MSLVTVCYDFASLRLNFDEWLLIITYATEKVRNANFQLSFQLQNSEFRKPFSSWKTP